MRIGGCARQKLHSGRCNKWFGGSPQWHGRDYARILVMGAAEYRGRPSQVLQARLNHALLLYLRGLAPYILTTGGSGGDPDFTEGEVGRDYLIKRGVRSEAIITEKQGSTTGQTIDAAAETMHRMSLRSCIVVSDGYHIFRVKRLLEAQGLKVYGSPRPQGRAPLAAARCAGCISGKSSGLPCGSLASTCERRSRPTRSRALGALRTESLSSQALPEQPLPRRRRRALPSQP